MGMRILVVDDEEKVLKSIQKVIASKRCDIKINVSDIPSAGIEMAKNSRYDLLIVDMMMPGMDGVEFIKRIRIIDPTVKIIMITGYATMKTALVATRAGADSFVAKPFTRKELLAAVETVLNREYINT
jgi:DNA-binding response OmpR family regulator